MLGATLIVLLAGVEATTWIERTGNSSVCERLTEVSGVYGVISSPGFGETDYPPQQTCQYAIAVQSGYVIRVRFSHFNLEMPAKRCVYDSLDLYDGGSATSPLLGSYCGDEKPPALRSSSNSLFMVFKTDATTQAPGYRLVWNAVRKTDEGEAACSGGEQVRFSGLWGSLSQPAFDSVTKYGNNLKCSWLIEAQENMAISVRFTTLDLESEKKSCSYDHVSLFNGNVPLVGNRIGRYCGTKKPFNVRSIGNKLLIKFESDAENSGVGFKIQWKQVTAKDPITDGCSKIVPSVVTNSTGRVTSPAHDRTILYNPNLFCRWWVKAPQGAFIKLEFPWVDVEFESKRCAFDSLMLSDPLRKIAPRIYCGSQTLRPLLWRGTELLISFTTDKENEATGFDIRYEFVPENYQLGNWRSFETTTGAPMETPVPTTPGEVLDREFRVNDDPGARRTTVQRLAFIRNTERTTTTPRPMTPRPTTPRPTTPRLTTRAAPTSTVSTKATTVSHFNCKPLETFDAEIGIIQTPRYGVGNYPASSSCAFLIRSRSSNDVIDLKWLDFGIEGSQNCAYDSVSVYDGSTPTTLLKKLCGQRLPDAIRTSGREMLIVFESDGKIQDSGFKASYKSVPANNLSEIGCYYGITRPALVTAQGGVIQSMSNPEGGYKANQRCAWKLSGPKNSQVKVRVEALDMSSTSGGCGGDRLIFNDGHDQMSPNLRTLCGNGIPSDELISTGPNLFIQFTTDGSTDPSKYGFRLRFEIAESTNTSSDDGTVVTIFGGESVSSSLISETNPGAVGGAPWNEQPVPFTTVEATTQPPPTTTQTVSQNDVCIQTAKGPWNRSSYAGCTQGLIHVLRGGSGTIVSSPDFDRKTLYKPDISCQWRLEAARGRHIRIKFRYLDLENGGAVDISGATTGKRKYCRFDDLSVYKRNVVTASSRVGTYCGGQEQQDLVVEDSIVTITFSTDNYVFKTGFCLTWSAESPGATPFGGFFADELTPAPQVPSGCGDDKYLEGTGYITTPEFGRWTGGSKYPPKMNCEWVISQPTGTVVRINILDINLEDSYECKFDSLELYDGSSELASHIGKYCGGSIPGIVYSTGNRVMIRFISDSSKQFRGFRLEYTYTDPQ